MKEVIVVVRINLGSSVDAIAVGRSIRNFNIFRYLLTELVWVVQRCRFKGRLRSFSSCS